MMAGWRHGAGWMLAALAVNGLIFAMGWNGPSLPEGPAWQPGGGVIGGIWLVLFFLTGMAQGRLARQGDKAHMAVVAVLLACLAYPLYTAGLQASLTGLVGNLLTLGAMVPVMALVGRKDAQAAWLLVPLTLWLAFAAVLTQTVLRMNGVL